MSDFCTRMGFRSPDGFETRRTFGPSHAEVALEVIWAHVDAMHREGWLACCKEFRSYDDEFIDSIAGDVESKAPGEAE